MHNCWWRSRQSDKQINQVHLLPVVIEYDRIVKSYKSGRWPWQLLLATLHLRKRRLQTILYTYNYSKRIALLAKTQEPSPHLIEPKEMQRDVHFSFDLNIIGTNIPIRPGAWAKHLPHYCRLHLHSLLYLYPLQTEPHRGFSNQTAKNRSKELNQRHVPGLAQRCLVVEANHLKPMIPSLAWSKHEKGQKPAWSQGFPGLPFVALFWWAPSHGMTSVTGSEELVEVSQPRVPPAGTPSGVPVFWRTKHGAKQRWTKRTDLLTCSKWKTCTKSLSVIVSYTVVSRLWHKLSVFMCQGRLSWVRETEGTVPPEVCPAWSSTVSTPVLFNKYTEHHSTW